MTLSQDIRFEALKKNETKSLWSKATRYTTRINLVLPARSNNLRNGDAVLHLMSRIGVLRFVATF